MPTKEEISETIQRQIVALIYKALSLKNKYPELTLLKMSSTTKYLLNFRSWREKGWINELGTYKSHMAPYDLSRPMSKFFNWYLMEPTLNKIMGMSGIKNPFDILAVFKYGSRVYGCTTDKSDFDYILIKKSGPREERSIERENININIVSQDDYLKDLDNHEIYALECWYLHDKNILRNEIRAALFTPSLLKLRHSISEKASHSFVKAKKKFIVPEDRNIYAGKKSLFHSLRIIDFGSQIAKLGRIEYYDAANYLHKEIMNNPSEDWGDYHKIYKPLYNNMMTNFRLLAPKE